MQVVVLKKPIMLELSISRKPISLPFIPSAGAGLQRFAAVNYHKWPICDDACILGKSLQVPVYQFVKSLGSTF